MQMQLHTCQFGLCFLLAHFKLSKLRKDTRNKSCILGQERYERYRTGKVAAKKISTLAFLDENLRCFRHSKLHSWINDEKPTKLQVAIFVLKLVFLRQESKNSVYCFKINFL